MNLYHVRLAIGAFGIVITAELEIVCRAIFTIFEKTLDFLTNISIFVKKFLKFYQEFLLLAKI